MTERERWQSALKAVCAEHAAALAAHHAAWQRREPTLELHAAFRAVHARYRALMDEGAGRGWL